MYHISLLDLVNTNIPDAIQNITVYQLIYKRLETGELFLNTGCIFQRMTVTDIFISQIFDHCIGLLCLAGPRQQIC